MDNFRRPRRPTFRSGMDGMVPSQTPKRAGSIGFNSRPRRSLTQSNNLDNFKKPEGFHPSSQPEISTGLKLNPSAPPIPEKSKAETVRPRKRGRIRRVFSKLNPLSWARDFRRASRRKKVVIILATLLSIFLLVTALLAIKAYIKSRNVFQGGQGAAALNTEVDPALLKTEGDGRINILVLGKGGPGHDGPDLTDTILLVSIDPIQHEAGLLSIPRDLYVQAPGDGTTKINAVYALAKERVLNSGRATRELRAKAETAGLDAIKSTVQDVLGVPIHYRVMVDFEAFRKAIDTVGGITIDVKQELYDPSVAWENNWNPVIAPVGVQKFDGKRALLYSRSRHGSLRGDFDRTERQRQVILALKDKVLSLGTFSNPLKISQLIDAFGNHVITDFNRNDLPKLYQIASEIPSNKIKSIGLADPPNNFVKTANMNGLSVVVPTAGLNNYQAIRSYVRNTLRDSFLLKENAEITVLNGTNTPGLAQSEADVLKSYGYRIGHVGDAPTKNYTNTTLVNLRGDADKYTSHYLELRLKTTSLGSLPSGSGINPGTADFVIIVGTNADTSQN